MLDVVANLAVSGGKNLLQVAANTKTFRGYVQGVIAFTAYQSAAIDSSACNDLLETSLAVDWFALTDYAPRTPYNQWRAVVQGHRIRRQKDSDYRAGGTDFFVVANP